MRYWQDESGFTLIEVLVSLAIAGLAFATLFSMVGNGLMQVAVAGRYQQALSRAKSHLALIGRDAPLVPGSTGGDDGGGFSWSERTIPIEAAVTPTLITTASNDPPPARPVLYGIALTVTWSEGGRTRRVQLRTRRLGYLPGAGR